MGFYPGPGAGGNHIRSAGGLALGGVPLYGLSGAGNGDSGARNSGVGETRSAEIRSVAALVAGGKTASLRSRLGNGLLGCLVHNEAAGELREKIGALGREQDALTGIFFDLGDGEWLDQEGQLCGSRVDGFDGLFDAAYRLGSGVFNNAIVEG